MPVWQLDISQQLLSLVHTVLSDHECSLPGCKNVLVIDGNMKNRRDVCPAVRLGLLSLKGYQE